MKKSLLSMFLLGAFALLQAQQIPPQITYCGVNITLTQGAQERLATYVAGIYESPRYYNAMVQRAYTFMPFIEEALKKGFQDKERLYSLEDTALLRIDAKFNKLVAKYLKDARYTIEEQ